MKYFFFFLFFTALLEAQILNVDRITQTDSITSKWAGFTDVSFSSDKLKNNVLDGSAKFELNHFFENKYFIVGLLNNDFTLNGKEVIQNEGFIQIRYRDMDTREWSTEAFVQYQWNGALGMEYRKVIGTNVRKRFFEKKKLDLYAGLGVFHESEQWNWSGVTNYEQLEATPTLNRSLFRLNNYWKIAYKINENVDISAISYFQLPINRDFLNMRWFIDLNTYIKMSKNLSFIIHYDHTIDNYRLVPVANFYYSLNFGIQLKW
jgi:hypothetical protein